MGNDTQCYDFFLNLLFILKGHWRTPVFFASPALHRDVLECAGLEQC